MRRSRALVVALALVGVAAGALGALRWWLTGELSRLAAAHRVNLSWDGVRPTWSGVELAGVAVTPMGPSRAAFRGASVFVSWGTPRSVVISGGQLELAGEPGALLRELREQQGPVASKSAVAGSAGTRVLVRGVALRWRRDEGASADSIELDGIATEWPAPALQIAISAGRARWGGVEGELRELVVRASPTDGGWQVQGAELGALSLGGALEDPSKAPSPGAPEAAQAGGARSFSMLVSEKLREATQVVGLAAGVFTPGASIRVEQFDALASLPGGELRLGPGAFVFQVEADRALTSLAPWRGDGAKRLGFSLALPIGAGASTGGVEAELEGGPVSLATLGVKDGDYGLMDVAGAEVSANARVRFDPGVQRVRADGYVSVSGVSFRQEAISDSPVRGLAVSFRGAVESALDGSDFLVEAGELNVDAVRLKLAGEVRREEHGIRVVAAASLPLTGCQAILDSAPQGLLARVGGMKVAGSLGVTGVIRLDSASVEREFFLPWEATSSCRVTEVPAALSVSRFDGPFTLSVPSTGGQMVELEVGPGTGGWVPFPAISRFMLAAVQTTEDGRFMQHNGFDEAAIRSAIRDDIKRGELYRGASTISMQLAKNLYLDRKKTLGRKLEEAVLTTYLEQSLTKERILELYLNVVELGPMVYGVGPAARHYFQSSAGSLSVAQAFYLASLLPSPSKSHFAGSGRLTPGWSRYLRKLMTLAHARRRITDEELAEGLREIVVFGSPRPEMEPEDGESPPSTQVSSDDDPPLPDED